MSELTIEQKCRIVEGAPDKTAFYDIENNKNISIEDASIAMIFLPHRFLIMDNLRAELLAHDTDNAERKAGIDYE